MSRDRSDEELPANRLVRTREAAVILGLRAQTLRRWRMRGKGPPYVRLSPTWCAYSVDELAAYVAARTFTSTSDETVTATGAATPPASESPK